MNEKKIILFTGGLDSTFSVIKYLSEGYKIDAILVDSVNFPNAKYQKEAVKNIYELLVHSKLHFEAKNNLGIYESRFDIPSIIQGNYNGTERCGYLMIATFINSTIYMIDKKSKNDIILSYNREDEVVENDIWILNEIEQVIKSLSKMQLIGCGNIDDIVTVSYPLLSYTKEKITEKLVELSDLYNIGTPNQLLKTIRWCESSRENSCIQRELPKESCMCRSCKRMKHICEKYNLF